MRTVINRPVELLTHLLFVDPTDCIGGLRQVGYDRLYGGSHFATDAEVVKYYPVQIF